MDEEYSLICVALTAEDFARLGPSPKLEKIASHLLDKILEAQPTGPYAIGGFCLGGILAYEVASQLRAAGHEVSLVVLVDPPNPSYAESCDSLKRMMGYLGYVVRRAGKLGVGLSMDYLAEHLRKQCSRIFGTRSNGTEAEIAQRVLEGAAWSYHPKRYDGNVLLVLASERPPHVNRLLGWQAVVTGHLQAMYLDAHHRDLIREDNARIVADGIMSELASQSGPSSINRSAPLTSQDLTAQRVKRQIEVSNH